MSSVFTGFDHLLHLANMFRGLGCVVVVCFFFVFFFCFFFFGGGVFFVFLILCIGNCSLRYDLSARSPRLNR